MAGAGGHTSKYYYGTRSGVIAIVGGKGGCGKTTTAFGLAGVLGRRRQETTVVDLDRAMPDCHLLAGVDRRPTLAAVTEGQQGRQLSQPVPTAKRVSILPAPQDTAPPTATLLETLSGEQQYILDCPCGAGNPVAAAIQAASVVVVVMTPTAAGVAAAKKTVSMARTIGTPPQVGAVVGQEQPPEPLAERVSVPRLVGIPRCGQVPPAADADLAAYRKLADVVTTAATGG